MDGSVVKSLETVPVARIGASVNVYLILREGSHKDSKVLLLLRSNTGYFDGSYGLVSGHVENGESATNALVREAYEEAGICILPSSLKVVHVMHRMTNRFNVDIFFQCCFWENSIINKEPDKCAALEFFPIDHLPSNTIDYVLFALQAAQEGQIYSEYGWVNP